MLNTFAIVLHWLGFIGSVGFTGLYLTGLYIFVTPKYGFSSIEFEYWIQLVAAAFGPLGSAWAIRFILTGHKGLMPWSKAKQPLFTES
jgi:hypothetical protein